MSTANPKVDFFFVKDEKWRPECRKLREIALDRPVAETLKWGCPCYTFEQKNIVLIHGFKDYCALLFFKGALMDDPEGILVQQTENVQAGRQIRFTSLEQIIGMETSLKAYIDNAIQVEKAGLKVEYKQNKEIVYPTEFQTRLDSDTALKAAYEALTPGRQRAYNLYFSAPKLAKTRQSRVESCVHRILDGKGLNDD